MTRRTVAIAALILLAACATQQPPPPAPPPPSNGEHLALNPVDYAALPGWHDDAQGEAIVALKRSCARLVELPEAQPIGRDGSAGSAGDWLGPCGALRDLDIGNSATVRNYFETWFAPFRATADGKTDGLFTGYYEAELKGSLTKQGKFNVPLYARPDDLLAIDLAPFEADLAGHRIWGRLDGNRLVPYWTRAEIDGGALGERAHPLIWVDDPVDAHILSIQGSGRIALPDGGIVRVGFDGTNGRTFLGLTRILLDAGKLAPDQSTMPETRAWLEAHPAEATALMAKNPRYVFFRLIEGDGPIGAEGVPLTPLRSLAVDTRFVPLGVPLWLATTTPDGATFRHMMIAQDTGAAIKGPVRGDIFWGTGAAAFAQAGRMKSRGEIYLLLPRKRSVPVAELDARFDLAASWAASRAPDRF
jgi:membrane-bound lytic murein transglycosylase A